MIRLNCKTMLCDQIYKSKFRIFHIAMLEDFKEIKMENQDLIQETPVEF